MRYLCPTEQSVFSPFLFYTRFSYCCDNEMVFTCDEVYSQIAHSNRRCELNAVVCISGHAWNVVLFFCSALRNPHRLSDTRVQCARCQPIQWITRGNEIVLMGKSLGEQRFYCDKCRRIWHHEIHPKIIISNNFRTFIRQHENIAHFYRWTARKTFRMDFARESYLHYVKK